MLDLAKLKKGDSIYFKQKNVPKLAERYDYIVIIVGGAKISEN
jgi:sortase (surface protein transpeptidase)